MISPQQVQKLREVSGAGIMDCKRAMEEATGDLDKAIQLLREKGKASAAKKAGRTTGQGLVCSWIGPTARKGGIVEISCETDFVARTKEFSEFAKNIAQHVAEKSIGAVENVLTSSLPGSNDPVETIVKEKIAKLGENILIKKVSSFGNDGSDQFLVGNYIHAPFENSPECGTLGVLLELKAGSDSPEVKALLRELCMQVAAASPKWVGKDNVPSDQIDKEKAIYKEQCRQSGKPEKAWDKITEGKLNDFYKQFCLLEQPHIRDSSGKLFVRSLLNSVSEKTGESVSVSRFVRFKVGEE